MSGRIFGWQRRSMMCHDRILTTKTSVNEKNVDNTAICDVEHHKKIPHIVAT